MIDRDRFEQKQEGEPTAQKFVRDVVYYLVIILFVGFATTFLAAATLMYDAWTNKAATYQELRNKVQETNTKIDAITTEICKQNKNKTCP